MISFELTLQTSIVFHLLFYIVLPGGVSNSAWEYLGGDKSDIGGLKGTILINFKFISFSSQSNKILGGQTVPSDLK